MPGPPPKRSDQRRRNTPPTKKPRKAPARPANPPEPDPAWHPAARRWYESLAVSGQSVFYEQSDYESAWLLAESLSRELNPQPIVIGAGEYARSEMQLMPLKGATLAAWLKGAGALLATEGDRRRAALELQRGPVEEAETDVSELAEYRRRLQSG